MKSISTMPLPKSTTDLLLAHGQYECIHDRPLCKEDVFDATIVIGNISKELVPFCNTLRLWQLSSAGSDTYTPIAPPSCVLCNASGTFGANIAEHLLMLTLMLFRNMPTYQNDQKMHVWNRIGHNRMIAGSKFLILGTGDLGSEFAMRIQQLGGYTIGIKRTPCHSVQYFNEVYTMDMLDQLLPQADAVVLCLPQNSKTIHIINSHTLFLMKKDSIVLNVGRGSAIDETALVKALQEGTIAACGLDVFEQEPLSKDSPLWDMEQVIITPHASGNLSNEQTYQRFYDIVQTNVENFFENRPFIHVVDRTWGY